MQKTAIAIFGEVLFDQFPDGQALLGGAPFNVAWHLQAFGVNADFISRVGDDALGTSVRKAMQQWGLATDKLQTDASHPTGKVAVSFNHGEPDYAILDQQAYDFIDAEPLTGLAEYALVYHGSLALRHQANLGALQQLTAKHSGKVFVDVNLRAPWWQLAQIQQLLATADWLKLNHHELALLSEHAGSMTEQMAAMIRQYQLETLIITCGEAGAVAMDKAGERIEVQPESTVSVVDTVGAGDAFAAVIMLGILKNWSLAVMMARAQTFASAVVGLQGALVQDKEFYQSFIDDWLLDG